MINGEQQRIPLPGRRCDEVLATTRSLFGTEVIEYRTPTATRLGAMLGIKEYPTPTTVSACSMRCSRRRSPFVLTQSFAFLTKATGQGLLQRQHARMAQCRGLRRLAGRGTDRCARCADQQRVRDGRPSLHAPGARGCALCAGRRTARPASSALNDHVAQARALLADTGMTVAREDLALEAAFWAQLPGNFAYRPRKAPITSRNFAAMASFHNFPTGARPAITGAMRSRSS